MLRNRPRLAVTCGRCGKPRTGIKHDCVSNSRRRATLKPAVTLGKCGKCKKPLGNPFTHVCAPRSDFKAHKLKAAKAEKEAVREKARKKRQAGQHDPESCSDKDCKRPMCVAFKKGRKLGYQEGYADGYGAAYAAAYAKGFAEGLASCPGPHNG